MDLLASVRKEGSRGGVNFSWDDVKSSQHRENYLGHSLMAPVGRWQKGKDLNWYAKADDAELTPEERLEREQQRKREELRKVKEAEEDAMARALGLPVPDRSNANNEPLGESKLGQDEVKKVLKEALDDGPAVDLNGDVRPSRGDKEERMVEGSGTRNRRAREHSSSRYRGRRGNDEVSARHRRRRSRSRDRDREQRHRHRHRRHSPPRSPSRERRRRRSRSRDGRGEDKKSYDERSRSRDRTQRRHRSRQRSRSPYDDRRRRNGER